ncbi:type VI secretion protein IcmF/TssM N-terminal domain-containing protein [Paraburkholderia humisilvae]|uniref:Type VI secretion system component TssM1 N-terminal domain-containing protein n=1 Tax=Paraburkholderia humisilvae TaxID=627669 RepID=A0A6J5EUE9_9BURK|nr:type VI secretion protein IcmF/TssM N-terminal domain-containing protein [Paraburkholderia humisilvae]CAB3770189.1 hypothetical protein LMG29542_06294 [Paraburkholderia humisilvae]
MTVTFQILLVIGVLLGLLAAVLIWRARSAAPAPAQLEATDAPARGPGGWVSTVFEAIDYARTRRAWRYRLPWLLLLGERMAGKSSFSRSGPNLEQPHPDRRYAALRAAGASWAVMNRGVLIDIDGAASAAPSNGAAKGAGAPNPAAPKPASRWSTLLSALVDLRPERPVDAIVLSVSARTLLDTDPQVAARAGADAYRQLCDVQDAFQFVLPVYVVVTQCDAINGFGAFWRQQPDEYRKQMFGWSAPLNASNDTPAEWGESALAAVVDQLRTIQLEAAAHSRADLEMAEREGAVLFPSRLHAVHGSLSRWLALAFRATVDRPGHLCRGIYFTGDIDGNGVVSSGVTRSDVSFVDHLIDDKMFTEWGGARAMRSSVWSRNRFLRSFQLGAVMCAAACAIALSFAGYRLYSTVERLDRSLTQLQSLPPYEGGVCPSAAEISTLLMALHDLDTRSFDLANPWSWTWPWPSHPLRDGAIRVAAAHAFNGVILPGLGCQLTARARELIAHGENAGPVAMEGQLRLQHARDGLTTHLRSVIDLEHALATYRDIVRPLSGAATRAGLESFGQLVNFAYALPVSLVTQNSDDSVLARAVWWGSTDYQPNLPDRLPQIYSADIVQDEQALRDELVLQASVGKHLLAQLNTNEGDAAAHARYLVWWLDWTRDNWLGTAGPGRGRNLCEQIREDLLAQTRALVQAGSVTAEGAPVSTGKSALAYGDLPDITARIFSPEQCDAAVYAALDSLKVPPYDPLIETKQGERSFVTAFAAEFDGLTELARLHYMQTTRHAEPFVCHADGAGSPVWSAAAIGNALNYVNEYRAFAQRFRLGAASAPGTRPLYARIALKQLENAMNHALNDAQRTPQSAGPSATDPDLASAGGAGLTPVSFDEQTLAQSSRDLAQMLGSLVAVERSYAEFGFTGSYAAISSCLQQIASNHLSDITGLALQSRLFMPQANPAGSDFYELGTVAVTRDYLARQVARAQVLAGYASPFAALAQNAGSGANAQPNVQTVAYWSNSIAEINRYVPANDPSGQLGQLASLFVDRLNGMNAANCHARMQSYASADQDANNLFASLRRTLVADTNLRCAGADADAFGQLFMSFDAALAGRFPFASLDAPDASPAAVREFFASYALQRNALRTQAAALPKAQRKVVTRFLDQLDAAQAFFDATLRADGTLAVHLNATFNARPGTERGADQVISWTLTSGDHAAGYPNRPSGLDWVASQPLALDLTWADLSVWTPHADPARADAPEIDGPTATFATTGTWALMRMVQQHVMDNGATPADGVTLRYDVPVATRASAASGAVAASSPQPVAAIRVARLLVNLQMQGTDPTSRTALPLRMPTFPLRAPTLAAPLANPTAQLQDVPPLPTLPALPQDAGEGPAAPAKD